MDKTVRIPVCRDNDITCASLTAGCCHHKPFVASGDGSDPRLTNHRNPRLNDTIQYTLMQKTRMQSGNVGPNLAAHIVVGSQLFMLICPGNHFDIKV